MFRAGSPVARLQCSGRMGRYRLRVRSGLQRDSAQKERQMEALSGRELRDRVADLTKLGSRVIWDEGEQIRGIAVFGPEITDRHMAWLRQLPGLRELDLTRSPISDAGLFHISKLHDLETLMLGRTDISDDGFEQLEDLKRLKNLNLISTGITDRSLEIVAGMSDLEALWLDTTDVTDAGLVHVAGLKRLELIDLRKTLVTDAGLEHLAGLTRMMELNLSSCEGVTGSGFVHLLGMNDLEWLNLDATEVNDAGIALLSRLSLKHLSLSWTSISDVALDAIEVMPELTHLEILGTTLTPARVEALRENLPRCRVHFSPYTDAPL
ncbi:Internalin-A precursor [Maioricimonas rarisocia]|uniref:Internalin-A n=2 Tax=Maioricimonas rarisocia TaxID=2528026 RepID=A0A517ZFJ1_9PLAN|nr:Internalin-A precursor [Maioricimonas rarisocia]